LSSGGIAGVSKVIIPFDRQVQELLEGFDFDLVKRIMDFLHWTYEANGRVPTIAELKEKARSLLGELRSNPGIVGSGGLRASKKEDGTLSLKFILTEFWSPFNSEENGDYDIT
jgi:hypothetical protein